MMTLVRLDSSGMISLSIHFRLFRTLSKHVKISLKDHRLSDTVNCLKSMDFLVNALMVGNCFPKKDEVRRRIFNNFIKLLQQHMFQKIDRWIDAVILVLKSKDSDTPDQIAAIRFLVLLARSSQQKGYRIKYLKKKHIIALVL